VNYNGDHGDQIRYVSLDGGTSYPLDTGGATISGPRSLAIDPAAGRIYWANFFGNAISYANLNGSGGDDLNTTGATPPDHPEGVAIDPVTGRIYWSDFTFIPNTRISYANLNGSGGGNLNLGGATLNYPHGVAIDPEARRIYWTNFFVGVLSYANLDTIGGADFLNLGLDDPAGPDLPILLKGPVGVGSPTIAGGSHVGNTLTCGQGSWAPDMLSSLLYRAPESDGFTYRWSRNGTDVPGVTTSFYTPSSDGQYRCTVTARNAAGTAQQTSAPQAITASGSQASGNQASSETPECLGRRATLLARPEFDGILRGTLHRDVIVGTKGHDIIEGRSGGDVICAGGGEDTVKGGAGNDTLMGRGGDDTLLGQAGQDTLVGGSGHDICIGGPGKNVSSRC